MSPRASTRLKGRPRVSLAETTSDSEDKFVENNASAPAKPTRGTKRKMLETNKDEKAVGGSKTKKLRGLLRALVEMPLDILFEVCNTCRFVFFTRTGRLFNPLPQIFGCLEPLDLLHLSRTSKALRALLMNRSSLSVWKLAFSNVPYPAPPYCPRDLNEPQYAVLVFGKTCHVSHRTTSSLDRKALYFINHVPLLLSSSVERAWARYTEYGLHG